MPQISAAEYAIRRESVAAGMQASGLDALCVFYPARVAYLTGFHHIPTERPIALVIGSSGQSSLIVPAVEKEHAETSTSVDQVRIYFEYPGAEHPMESVAAVLTEMRARPQRTGADHDGYVPFWGYRGPRLSDLTGGFGAEVAAIISEHAFEDLDGPVVRVAAPDIPAMPFNTPQEEFFMPSPEKIAEAMRKLAAY